MKQTIISVFLLLIFLYGCAPSGSSNNTPVFYYPKSEYTFNEEGSVLQAEQRSTSYAQKDISEIITDYLKGPESEKLRSAFPTNVELLECRTDKSGLHITLSASVAQLDPMDMTIGFAALARTCFDFTDAEAVCIHADSVLLDGEQKIVFTREDILYWDEYIYVDPTTAPTSLPTETQGE